MPTLNNISTRNWEASSKPKLQSLEPYKKLFAKPLGIDKTVEKNAGVSHTVAFIPQVVKQCAWQVEDYVKQELAGLSLEQACYKLWHFVRFHVEWVRDADGKEQVRSPRRLIWDGKGDCDCMTTFVDTSMKVYGVKGIINRIVAYDGNENFSHIYSLIPNGKGGHIIIDCCFPQFNQQKKYTKKEDYNMELQFLDGIENTEQANNGTTISDTDLTGNIMGELGRLLKRNANKQSSGGGNRGGGIFKKKTSEQKQAAKETRKQVVKKVGKKTLTVINKVNKVNPATVLLRAGILASMKLNILKVAERIKWGYAPPELAASKGMDMSKYQRVKGVLAQAEKVFFAAGGKAVNLRKAIMEGKGNQNRELSGQYNYNESTPLHDLLGAVYTDEFVNGMEGVEGLGEPATAASITAAAGAMGALAALLASIGTLFPKKDKKVKKEKKAKKIKRQAPEPTEEGGGETPEPPAEEAPQEEAAETETQEANEETSETETTPATTEEAETPAENNETETGSEEPAETEKTEETTEGLGGLMGIKAFYQANKNWIVPVASIATGIIGTVIVYELFGSDTKETKNEKVLNGLEGSKHKGEEDEQSVIALM